MELLKNLKSVPIISYKENFWQLHGFVLLNVSIESDNHNWAIKKHYKEIYLHLYGFMFLNVSIVR